jgi:predicted MPP superfamily phosphohydrolase
MLKIIHISDFHLETAKASYDKEQIVKALCNDIKKYIDENTLVFFTGDLIDRGGIGFKDQKDIAFLAFEEIFIDKILTTYPALKNRIFIVPGNHDVFRDKIDAISDIGLKNELDSEHHLDEFIDNNKDTVKHLERLVDYKEWERTFYSSYPNKHLSNFENTFICELKDYTIGITCLNSSAM